MKVRLLTLFLMAGFLPACASTPFVGKFSPQAARREARHDFAAGTPKIYRAGGFAVFEPGISESQRKLVARFPRDGSMTGCINRRMKYSEGFATAYNREIILLLQTKR